ncbi:hypothetical protein [Micromonospora sp. DPT]|uniref:hypothetical protein n=1 Tax=Micromonospora sp. DPT TaxID=3142975 RepID=UPI003208590F
MAGETDETPFRGVDATRAFGGSAVALVVAGTVALLSRQPWLFPSLGPAVMLHVEQPGRPESSPRNTLIGVQPGHWPGDAVVARAVVSCAGEG